MTLQMLPIAQIGQMLSTNQWNEELPHSVCDHETKAINNLNSDLFPQDHNFDFIVESKVLAYLHFSDQIPSNHSTDVILEPPNLLV